MGTPGIMVNQSRRQPFSSSGSVAGQCCKATYKGSYYDSTSYMLKEIHPIADHIISGQLLVSVWIFKFSGCDSCLSLWIKYSDIFWLLFTGYHLNHEYRQVVKCHKKCYINWINWKKNPIKFYCALYVLYPECFKLMSVWCAFALTFTRNPN